MDSNQPMSKPNETTTSGPESGLMRRREVAAMLAVSESTIKRMVRHGELPKPVVITKGRVGWFKADIAAWLRQRARRADGGRSPM
jgi:excisionase family DNA binding protein